MAALLTLTLLYSKIFEEQVKQQSQDIGLYLAQEINEVGNKILLTFKANISHKILDIFFPKEATDIEREKVKKLIDVLYVNLPEIIILPNTLETYTRSVYPATTNDQMKKLSNLFDLFLTKEIPFILKEDIQLRSELLPCFEEIEIYLLQNKRYELKAGISRPKKSGRPLDISVPLYLGTKKKIIGEIHTIISTPSSATWLVPEARQLIVVTFLSILIIAASIFIYLTFAISNPIRRLVEKVEEARKGNLDILIQPTSADEIGWLTANFSIMLQQISRFNKELARKVEIATSDLTRKNKELEIANEKLFTIQRKLGQIQRLAWGGQLSTNLAHEIGTTLNVIMGHIQIMLATPNYSSQTRERLDIINSQLIRLSDTVRKVLKTVRLPEPVFSKVSVNLVVSSTFAFLKPTFDARNVKCVLNLGNLPQIYADKYQLEQVFINILTNSIDAMPNGGTLTCETALSPPPEKVLDSTGPGKKYLSIKFTDTGIGIPPENLGKIFEPFFSTKTPDKGGGIGLTICKEIIEKQGGIIRVADSKVGKGTTFEIILPAS